MSNKITLKKIIDFFVTRIIVGIACVVGAVALIEWGGRILLDKTQLSDDIKSVIIGIADSAIALFIYIFLFSFYEKRKIKELSAATFVKYGLFGFFTGFILQSLIILVIYLFASYSILHVNPVSFLFPGFGAAIAAGFAGSAARRG